VPVAKQYEDETGRSPYAQWFEDIHAPAAAKVTKAVIRMEQGNFSNVKPVGSGVSEYTPSILAPAIGSILAGTETRSSSFWEAARKNRQQRDINLAIERWQDYKRRKKLGEK
jgi:hypothetical protein